MNRLRIATVLLFAMPVVAVAQGAEKYYCTSGDMVRRVEIFTEPGTAVPCEVHYFKDTEAPGEFEVLWRAQADAGYCQARAAEFVARLENWGWTCRKPEVGPAPEPLEPDAGKVEDDTDVLSPAGPED